MERMAPRRLLDLFATAESIRHDQRVGRSRANRGQQHPLTDRLRNGERVGLEAKRAGHPAASRVGTIEDYAHLSEHRLLVAHLHQSFLVAMPVQQHRSLETRKLIRQRPGREEFGQKERLAAQT